MMMNAREKNHTGRSNRAKSEGGCALSNGWSKKARVVIDKVLMKA